MPAYRSEAEREVRDAAVARVREARPGCRIIHEINCSSWGPNRVDFIAVSPMDIVAVEVKSAKDKLDRLPQQLLSMRGFANVAVAALHENFLVEQTTNRGAAHYERDGVFYLGKEPEEARAAHEVWVFPERKRNMHPEGWCHLAPWAIKPAIPNIPLPDGAIDLLWREELQALCRGLGVRGWRTINMTEAVARIRWGMTGEQITRAICATLRARKCTEADPPIENDEAIAA